mmetsp:Transcript_35754/g.102792  ORF Transcript_35754/g.102792 Transcript_35754/m.102792 type:complete len:480 (-) Transcript_35754:158-1597(-)
MHTGIRAASSNRPAVRRHRHSLPRPSPGPPSHATLEKIRFEEVQYGMSGHSHVDYDERQLPPPSAPVHLPALTTVTRIPAQHAWGRAGRLWVTPNVTTLTFDGRFVDEVEYDGAREWIGGCSRLEKLEYDTKGNQGDNERLLTAMPEGQGLAGLRSLGRVRTVEEFLGQVRWDAAGVDQFRQLLVRRGCVRSLQEMTLDMGRDLDDTSETRRLIESAAALSDAVMHPDALTKSLMPCVSDYCGISLQVLAWSRQHRSKTVKKLVAGFAKGVRRVIFDERRQASGANPATPTSFPQATTLILPQGRRSHFCEQVRRAVKVAVKMPRLERIECREHWAWAIAFLEALHTAAPEKKLASFRLRRTADSLVDMRPEEVAMWSKQWIDYLSKMPAIESTEIFVEGALSRASLFECLYSRLTTMLVTLSKAEDTKHSCVMLCCEERLREKLHERFVGAMALFNLASTTHRLEDSLWSTFTLMRVG